MLDDQNEIIGERRNVKFHKIEFKIPDHLSEIDIPKIWTDGKGSFSGLGQRHMFRFYGIQIYDILSDLGYDWMMRMDDDSFIHSKIKYDLFDFMASNNYNYGYRVDVLESNQSSSGFRDAIDHYMNEFGITSILYKKSSVSFWRRTNVVLEAVIGAFARRLGVSRDVICPSPIRVHNKWGYYNNFFITKLDFWKQPEVKAFLNYIDGTGGMYTNKWGDLLIQSSAVKLFMPQKQIHKFDDWVYEHASIKNGTLIFGGIFPSSDNSNDEVVIKFKQRYGKLCTPRSWY